MFKIGEFNLYYREYYIDLLLESGRIKTDYNLEPTPALCHHDRDNEERAGPTDLQFEPEGMITASSLEGCDRRTKLN